MLSSFGSRKIINDYNRRTSSFKRQHALTSSCAGSCTNVSLSKKDPTIFHESNILENYKNIAITCSKQPLFPIQINLNFH